LTFSTTYHFTGKFRPDESEIFGRCQHPLVSGGDGRIDFKDVAPDTGGLEYRGHLRLNGA
ncbi:MAG: hypothetical protein ACR2OI_07135, partial [Acidimicrobiia bacterium]